MTYNLTSKRNEVANTNYKIQKMGKKKMNVKRKLDSEFSGKYWNFDKKFDLRVSMVMI